MRGKSANCRADPGAKAGFVGACWPGTGGRPEPTGHGFSEKSSITIRLHPRQSSMRIIYGEPWESTPSDDGFVKFGNQFSSPNVQCPTPGNGAAVIWQFRGSSTWPKSIPAVPVLFELVIGSLNLSFCVGVYPPLRPFSDKRASSPEKGQSSNGVTGLLQQPV